MGILSTAFIARQLVDNALASILESLASGSWADALPLLPPVFTTADAQEFLQQLGREGKLPANSVVFDRIAMSRELIQRIAGSLEAAVKASAERRFQAAPGPGKAGKKATVAASADVE